MNIICHENPLVDSIYQLSSERYPVDRPVNFIGAPAIHEHIILNDGCAEFLFEIDGHRFSYDSDLVCGKFLRVPKISVRFSDPEKELLIIRLKPYGLYCLSSLEQVIFVNTVQPLSTLDIDTSYAGSYELVKALEMRQYGYVKDAAYVKTIGIIEHIAKHFSELPKDTVRAMSGQFDISESSLRRYFKKYTGISLSNFMITVKRRKMVQALFENNYDSLSVRESGYYDQSHFINDFRRLYGIPLKAYIKRMRLMKNKDPDLMRFLYDCSIKEEAEYDV